MGVRVTINDMAMTTVLQELDRRLERAGQFVENNAKDNMQGHNRTSMLRRSIKVTERGKVIRSYVTLYSIMLQKFKICWVVSNNATYRGIT